MVGSYGCYRLYMQRLRRRQEWLDAATHGIEFLKKHCFDEDGRMFFLVTKDGKPLRKRRYLFSLSALRPLLSRLTRVQRGNKQYAQEAVDLFKLIIKYHTTPGLLEPQMD